MKKEAADQKRIAEEEKIKASMEQAKRQEDEKNLEKYVVGLLSIHLFILGYLPKFGLFSELLSIRFLRKKLYIKFFFPCSSIVYLPFKLF